MIFILLFCILLHVLYQGYWKNRPSQQLFKVFILYFMYFASKCFGPTGHLQVEYTIILGSYLTHYGSVVLCYTSRLLCMLANTAVVFLIVSVSCPNVDKSLRS
jgi:hypothetical protein